MKTRLIYFLSFLFLGLGQLFAQPTLPGTSDSGPGNVDDVPLNFLIYPLLILGAYLGFRFFKKK